MMLSSCLLLTLVCESQLLVRLLSGCREKEVDDWNKENVGHNLRSWLRSVVSLGPGEGDVQGGFYNPITGEWSDYYPGFNDQLDEGNYQVDTDPEVATIMKSQGIAWQWKGQRMVEGFLYTNELDEDDTFTGDNVIFLYPDLVTGLRGTFINGELVEGYTVEVVAERCNDGVKQIEVVTAHDSNVRWVKQEADVRTPGPHPKVMDPHERRSVYVGESSIPGSDEGVFARRKFLPGDLVSYFGGLQTFPGNFIFDNMTKSEKNDAASYFYNLALNSPKWWGLPEGMVIDTPTGMRDVTEYRTTLGHKVNTKIVDVNAEFSTLRHPVLGAVACVLATDVIEKGDEIFVDYSYDLDYAPLYYKQAYFKAHKNEMMKSLKELQELS